MPQGPFLRKYGVQATINFVLFEVDGVDFRVDAADGGSDCTVMKDEGAEATATNDFADEGKGYSLVLTATEMQAARIVVYVVDSATKAWLDEQIVIETYGHASAQHAMDLDATVPTVAEIQAEMEENGASILDSISDKLPTNYIMGSSVQTDKDDEIDTINTNAARLTAARAQVLDDWINDGRLDLLLDAIPTTAMRGTDNAATEAKQDIIDTNIDTLLTRLSAANAQTLADWIDGGRLDVILDIIAADTTTDIPALIAALNNISAADVKTAMEADGGDLSSLMEALVNKLLITEASGNAEIFNDAGASQGTVAAAFSSVAGVTQRKRIFK